MFTTITHLVVSGFSLLLAATAGVTAPEPVAEVSTPVASSVARPLTTEVSTASRLTMSNGADFDQFLASMVEDSATYWAGQFATGASTGVTPQWKSISYQIVDGTDTVVTACVNEDRTQTYIGDPRLESTLQPAMWCPGDSTVYLSSQWLYDVIYSVPASVDQDVNDFGVAYAVAHEVGHAVQTQLNISAPEAFTVSPTELQADCLAGVWGNAKYYQNVLDANDVEQGVRTAAAVGDEEWASPGHHGAAEERSNAFMVGYNSGTGASCTLTLPGAY
jgi:predicted metalloprotease